MTHGTPQPYPFLLAKFKGSRTRDPHPNPNSKPNADPNPTPTPTPFQASGSAAADVPISISKPSRGAASASGGGGRGGAAESERGSVREGWEELLHACCQHMYGTRVDALSPAVRVALKPPDLESTEMRTPREHRRRAMQTGHTTERVVLLYYLCRLCPTSMVSDGVGTYAIGGGLSTGGAVWPILSPVAARKVSQMRY